MRTFIAIDFPQEILGKISEITTYFKTQTPPRAVKWVDAHKIHLTLKFIGELQESKLPETKSIIRDALQKFSTFTISVAGLGMFPNAGRPRVIWLGIQGEKSLVEIHNALDQNLTQIGIKSEKRDYHPHLTLGRVRRNAAPDTVEAIGNTLSEFKVSNLGSTLVDEIILYKSELTRKGPIYSPLYAHPLHQV